MPAIALGSAGCLVFSSPEGKRPSQGWGTQLKQAHARNRRVGPPGQPDMHADSAAGPLLCTIHRRTSIRAYRSIHFAYRQVDRDSSILSPGSTNVRRCSSLHLCVRC